MNFFIVELRTLIEHDPVFFGGPITRLMRRWMFNKSFAILHDPVDKMIVSAHFQEGPTIRWIRNNGHRVESDRLYWYAVLEVEAGEYDVSQQGPRIPKSRGYYDRYGYKLMKEPYGNG